MVIQSTFFSSYSLFFINCYYGQTIIISKNICRILEKKYQNVTYRVHLLIIVFFSCVYDSYLMQVMEVYFQ